MAQRYTLHISAEQFKGTNSCSFDHFFKLNARKGDIFLISYSGKQKLKEWIEQIKDLRNKKINTENLTFHLGTAGLHYMAVVGTAVIIL